MPSTPLGIPYPNSGGHTELWKHWQDQATALQTLIAADRARLAALEATTAWATPTAGTSVNLSPSGLDGTRYRKSGRTVELCIELSTTASTAGFHTLMTLPAGFRPAKRKPIGLFSGGGGFLSWGFVNPTGTVQIASAVGVTQILGEAVFLVA